VFFLEFKLFLFNLEICRYAKRDIRRMNGSDTFYKRITNYLLRSYNIASRKTVEIIDRAKMTEHLFMIILAIIIGILGGFGAIGIRALIKEISELSFSGEGTLLDRIISAPWYIKLLIPAVGGAIVGPIIYFFAPEAKGHGVPEVMQAILLKGGNIRPRVALIKAFASSITIGTGGSVGREGPIIQIGASLGSTIAQFFRVPSRRMKTLVGCGAAAGIAAAFNAPVAGALFAVEIILMDFAVAQFSPIVISSVMATVISHHFEGDFAAFQVPHGYHLASFYDILFYFVLGALTGLISFLFIKVLYLFEDVWDNRLKIPDYYKAAIGGVIVGSVALLFPEVMGVGYDSINMALNGNIIWHLALSLVFVKIFATSITLGSGGSGGIFAPSLFMGATLGVAFGILINMLFPNITADPGAYALVAMGGMVAGTTRAPITAIIIVFELTKDYNVILPLMIVCIIATILSSKLSRESIYTLKLLLRNIKIKERAEVNIMKSIKVEDVYKTDYEYITENMNFSEIVEAIISKKVPYIYVHDLKGKFMGVISIHNIKEMFYDRDHLHFVCIAGDIADKEVMRVSLYDDCKTVLDKMGMCTYDGLPVMAPDDPEKQIGVIWRQDIDNAYKKEIDHLEITSDLASKITMSNLEQEVRFMEGYSISEIEVPSFCINQSIQKLQFRSKYGVEILSIKNHSGSGSTVKAIPQANYIFKKGDVIVVAGKVEDVKLLKQLN
jgi:CIC family chloride channel protein